MILAVIHTMVQVLNLSQKQKLLQIISSKCSFTWPFFIHVVYLLNLFYRAQSDIIGAIDWHSYGELILRPYGIISTMKLN